MKVGTKSLLFGCHQFVLHPILVLIGWIRLYGSSSLTPGVVLAIVLHDIGYWGAESMETGRGAEHPRIAARMIFKLTRNKALYFLLLYHSRFYAHRRGAEPSLLCWADKWGSAAMPTWLWGFLAWLSGEGAEYMTAQHYELYRPGDRPTLTGLIRFHSRYREFVSGFFSGNGPRRKTVTLGYKQ